MNIDPNRKTSFPELVGRSAQEAAAFITAQGIVYHFSTVLLFDHHDI